MDKIIVVGHTTPDTDSACAAIVFADYLRVAKGLNAEPRIAGTLNRETEFVLQNFAVQTPAILLQFTSGQNVAIVDTNNPEELQIGWEAVNITHIADHHRLVGGLTTSQPISISIKPYGSTSSVIYELAKQDGVLDQLNIRSKQLILAAIISDTLKFISPVTTEYDAAIAKALALELNINIDELAEQMFTAKSDLKGFSARELIFMDPKIISLKGHKTLISGLETTKPENINEFIPQLRQLAPLVIAENSLEYFIFYVIDILGDQHQLLAFDAGSQALIEKAFKLQLQDGRAFVDFIPSRKKVLIPTFESSL